MSGKRESTENVDLDEDSTLSAPPKKLPKIKTKYVLMMGNSWWNRMCGYFGIEVQMSTDRKSYTITGNWIRLVSEKNGPLPPQDGVNIGSIFKVHLIRHAGHPNQPENWVVSGRHQWKFVADTQIAHPKENENHFLIIDQIIEKTNAAANDLWYDDQCQHSVNDRIRKEKLIEIRDGAGFQSCTLIHVDSLIVTLFHRKFGTKVQQERRGRFQYNGKTYELKINEDNKTLLSKIGEDDLLKCGDWFPPETEKLQKEIRPCHLLVALLADNIDRGIKPRDASETEFYYKTIVHIFTKGDDGEVIVMELEEKYETCQDLLDIAEKVPNAITAWEFDFLETNCFKIYNNYYAMTEAQQLVFVEIKDKLERYCSMTVKR